MARTTALLADICARNKDHKIKESKTSLRALESGGRTVILNGLILINQQIESQNVFK